MDEGYSPEEVVEAVTEAGDVSPERMAEYLVAAGLGDEEAAAVVVEMMLQRTLPVIMDFLAGFLGLTSLSEFTQDHLVMALEVLEEAGFPTGEAADWLARQDVHPTSLADALVATGMDAMEAATHAWGWSTEVSQEAVDWLLDAGVDAVEIAGIAASWGWDAASTILLFTQGTVGNLTRCVAMWVGGYTEMISNLAALNPDVGGPHLRAMAACVALGYERLLVAQEMVRQGALSGEQALRWLWETAQELPGPQDAPFWREHLTAQDAAQALADLQAPAEDVVAWLVKMGFDPSSIWSGMTDAFQLGAAEIAELLFEAGVPVDQILALLTTVANLTYDQAMAIITALGGG